MGPPPSPRETRRSGRRSAPSASASASKSPDSDQPPARERPNSSRTAMPSHNHRNKRLKQDDIDEPADDRKQTSASSISSATNAGNSKGKRKGKDKEKQSNGVAVNDDTDVVADDQRQDPVEDDEEQGITRCVCGSSGVLPKRPSLLKFVLIILLLQKTIPMLVNSWFNARLAKSGSMGFAWATSQRSKCMMMTIIAKSVDLNYT